MFASSAGEVCLQRRLNEEATTNFDKTQNLSQVKKNQGLPLDRSWINTLAVKLLDRIASKSDMISANSEIPRQCLVLKNASRPKTGNLTAEYTVMDWGNLGNVVFNSR